MSSEMIPFNKPYVTGNEFGYIQEAINAGYLSGGGAFSKRCQKWLEDTVGCRKAFLVHSGTAALELGALLLGLKPGDEVIMPSFTFVTTATAVVLRGAVPVFVDIRPDTLNIDENLIEAAITERTRAIMPVHYAGVGCEMDKIIAIAKKHNLKVLEDAAHTVQANYKGRSLGSFGDMAALSFHETKNITCGEGGALLINDESLVERAEILVEKGTDRTRYFQGLVDKYTWRDVGSSFLISEIEAAFLWAQMEKASELTARRLDLWNSYNRLLEPLEKSGHLRRPVLPAQSEHNAHMYYVLLNSLSERQELVSYLKARSIYAVFHYIPLHNSPAGNEFGRAHGRLPVTIDASSRILRLPLWIGLSAERQQEIANLLFTFFGVLPRDSQHNQLAEPTARS